MTQLAPGLPASPGLVRKLAFVFLLGVGCALLSLTAPRWHLAPSARVQYGAALVAAAAALIPSVQRAVWRVLERIRHPSPKAIRRTAAVLAAVSTLYLIFTGLRQGRDFVPKSHDEWAYLLQARMLTAGRLWMPPHPIGEFFESFYVLSRPVYAANYFPGTALLYAGVLAAHVEPALASALVCGTIVALTYVVVTEFTDGVGGMLAALLTLGLAYLHFLSLLVMAHTVVVLMSLAMIWAYQRWRVRRSAIWAVVLGIFAGWAAITRPLDALCFAIPLGVSLLWDLRGCGGRAVRTLGLVCVGAAPFIALQLVMDYGVTGHLLDSPFAYYARVYWPALSFGFDPGDPHWRPPTQLAQFQDFYREFFAPEFQAHAHNPIILIVLSRWTTFCNAALPCRPVLLLAPLGLLGLGRQRRWVLWAMIPLFLVGYFFYPLFLYHYSFVAAPAMILGVVLGARAVEETFPRHRALLATMTTLALTAAALTSLTELNPFLHDPADGPTIGGKVHRMRLLADVQHALDGLPHTPAVVLFRYTSGTEQEFHQEPVYNIDTAWPDDATVIRPHDLGPQENQKIFRYYAGKAPQRFFYLYDCKTNALTELGWARDLAK